MSTAERITVNIPAALSGRSPADFAERARLLLVIDEVRNDRMTRAGAARTLGMTFDAFLVAAGTGGLYASDYEVDELRSELDGIAPQRG